MGKLAKVDRFFKNVNLTSDDEVFVGIDVHKKSYHVALCLNDTPAIDFRMCAEPKQLNKKLGPMACAIKDTGPKTDRKSLSRRFIHAAEEVVLENCFIGPTSLLTFSIYTFTKHNSALSMPNDLTKFILNYQSFSFSGPRHFFENLQENSDYYVPCYFCSS